MKAKGNERTSMIRHDWEKGKKKALDVRQILELIAYRSSVAPLHHFVRIATRCRRLAVNPASVYSMLEARTDVLWLSDALQDDLACAYSAG